LEAAAAEEGPEEPAALAEPAAALHGKRIRAQ